MGDSSWIANFADYEYIFNVRLRRASKTDVLKLHFRSRCTGMKD